MAQNFRDLIREERGNFGVLTAVILPCLLGSVGIAIDLSSALHMKADLGAIADTAALAFVADLAKKKITTAQAEELAIQIAPGQLQMYNYNPAEAQIDVLVKATPLNSSSRTYEVSVKVMSNLNTSLMRIFGADNILISNVSTTSSYNSSENALSLYMVLDRSASTLAAVPTSIKSTTDSCKFFYLTADEPDLIEGPMKSPCYDQRLDVMKEAIVGLLQTLTDADPNKQFVRTGVGEFNNNSKPPSPIEWGVNSASKYVQQLSAEGGTSSTRPFRNGVDALLHAHRAKNGLAPHKALILMTDGGNTRESDDVETLAHCRRAKDNGIAVYTLAFMLTSTKA